MQLLRKYHYLIPLLLLGIMHFPFIHSDPDTKLSPLSRDAWTDEGLNTSQVRNLINHGYLSITECDNLVKTPAFATALVPFYFVLGTHLWVGRLMVLLSTILVLLIFLKDRELRIQGLLIVAIASTQFHIFHYSHYSMSEMFGVAFILAGFYFFDRHHRTEKTFHLILSVAFISLAWYAKIQYVYLIFLLPLVYFFLSIYDLIRLRTLKQKSIRNGLIVCGATAFFAAFYLLCWYLPVRDMFNYVMDDQAGNRFDPWANYWDRLKFNYHTNLLNDLIRPLIYALIVAPLLFIAALLKIKITRKDGLGILFASVWFILEMHKLNIVNPPMRYYASLFFAGGFLCALILAIMFRDRWLIWPAAIVAIVITGWNLLNYSDSYSRRTFQLREINNYIGQTDFDGQVFLGPWAPSTGWESNGRVMPVWNDFINHEDPINRLKPKAVITEWNENDNGNVFSDQGIDLKTLSDSSRSFQLWRYKLVVYWLK